MRKFLSYRLITAIILATALKVSADPPPAEPIIISSESTVATDCIVGGSGAFAPAIASPLENRCSQPTK